MTWSSYYRDDTDGLLHEAFAGYNAAFAGTQSAGPYPAIAYTRCGYMVTWDGFSVNGGEYVSREEPLTCVKCASGAREHERIRQQDKQALFGSLYGQRIQGSAQDRIQYVEYAKIEMEILQKWGLSPSIMKTCKGVKQFLYDATLAWLDA